MIPVAGGQQEKQNTTGRIVDQVHQMCFIRFVELKEYTDAKRLLNIVFHKDTRKCSRQISRAH